MEAAEAKIQKVLEGSKQFLVPHYQRPYSWKEDQWKTLWRDILELTEEPDPKPHFLGSIVTSPARSVPEGVEKRLLIDGQQRLTTLLVLLVLIRDRAREAGIAKIADRIQDLVTNRHEEGNEHYKLLPTQGEDPAESDRETFTRLVNGLTPVPKTGIGAAYHFYDSKLRRSDAPDLDNLFRTIITKLTLVSIILDERDNPHRIFESLNGKGRPLSQADLIRNYFFMRIHEREHERIYVDFWRPMQRRLGEEALTDFVRHYLTRFGQVIREMDVYSALKTRVDEDTGRPPEEHLKELARFSEYYAVLLKPEGATSAKIRERLLRLNRLEVTVAYPFLLSVYADHAKGTLTESAVVAILDTLENYMVRRFVCGVPTYGLNKVFAPLYDQASHAGGDLVSGVQRVLATSTRGYPRDETFRDGLTSTRLYGSGERREKTKLILERLEAALGHKEIVPGESLTIEHVLPQSPSEEWKSHLGSNWEEDHEELLHTLGNLTLTSYNPELGNSSFAEKKKLFAKSHVELNHYFASVEKWTKEEIERRAEVLAESALSLWPYFGPAQSTDTAATADAVKVTGTVPKRVRVRGIETPVQAWVDVAVATVEGIIALGDEEFDRVTTDLPRFVNRDATAFRRSSRLRKLSNGAYLETNLSASQIYRWSSQAAQVAGIGPGEWHVELAGASGGEEGEEEEAPQQAPSHIRQLQLQFWTQAREALEKSGQFPSLRPAKAQHWFDIALGRSGIWMSLTATMDGGRVGAKINVGGDASDQAMHQLMAQREAIEHELGAVLQWNPHPEKRTKTIKLDRNFDVMNRSTWPAAIDWLTNTASAFRAAFGPRIADLDWKTGK